MDYLVLVQYKYNFVLLLVFGQLFFFLIASILVRLMIERIQLIRKLEPIFTDSFLYFRLLSKLCV